MSSKEVTKEAIEHIEAALSATKLNLIVQFIDGEKLWELIENHMSERTVLYKLNQIKQICDEADEYYRIVPILSGNAISLTIQPKDPTAALDHPLSFTTHFKFPDTPEGRAKQEELENYVNTGSHMRIPKEFIEHMEIPDFVRKFVEPLMNVEWQVSSGSQPDPNKVLIVKIEVKCDDGEIATLDYITLLPVQSGRKQVILSNQFQKVPWRVRLTLKVDSRNERLLDDPEK